MIVSHSMEEVAEYAERIVVMERGEKRMDGTVFEVFEQAEALEEMGLSVPLGMKILHDLKNEGVDVDATKHRKMDICGELLKLKDINEISYSFESKKEKGVYFIGEVLNIDGPCGGYNLHNAWLTGMKAGKDMANCV